MLPTRRLAHGTEVLFEMDRGDGPRCFRPAEITAHGQVQAASPVTDMIPAKMLKQDAHQELGESGSTERDLGDQRVGAVRLSDPTPQGIHQ